MHNVAIKIENVSKQYRLGNVGTGSFVHDINRTWHRILGKENPYLKIGEENDRSIKGNSDYVWALKDINFEIKQGEVLGIIGRNGAGKSTLLKILSRTTSPTKGEIKIKGRVASLLEVGTGFHPELTGRENIFLNGAILGMTKQEIKSKLDEIIDFAGVERYIDTPVKRYSSGMYVRLAFAVAAHLDPEILIVDEVLAVGDVEFQNKALSKMQEVSSKNGRTILFVSHNLKAIKDLCPVSYLIEHGKMVSYGATHEIVRRYLGFNKEVCKGIWAIDQSQNESLFLNRFFSIQKFYISDSYNEVISHPLDPTTKFIYLNIEGFVQDPHEKLSVGFALRDAEQFIIINRHSDQYKNEKIKVKKGYNRLRVKIDISSLNQGQYFIDFNCALHKIKMINSSQENKITLSFSINEIKGDQFFVLPKRDSVLAPYLSWELLD